MTRFETWELSAFFFTGEDNYNWVLGSFGL